ncbi:MAG: exodeoxyribonuclease VII small subunit [Actinomycetota bacterium]|nr:exodeoxyribonuclease VII small subunit [Actinomycetota bacterium]
MKIEEMNFEESIKKLEEIVKKLEDENISLEESMKNFEMGIKLSSSCLKKLNEAEGKIEKLTRSEDGKLIAKELDLEEEN